MIKRRFHNASRELKTFHVELDKFNFENKCLIRPDFTTYFMRMADLCASRSNCMKRGVGCVIVKD
jgi:dCMP deaminase